MLCNHFVHLLVLFMGILRDGGRDGGREGAREGAIGAREGAREGEDSGFKGEGLGFR